MPLRSHACDPEALTQARRMYEAGEHRVTIAVRLGLERSVLDAVVAQEKWRRERRSKAAPGRQARRERPAVHHKASREGPTQPTSVEPGRAELAATITRAVERELAAIDAVLSRLGGEGERSSEAERTARTLASLARALKELKQLDASGPEPRGSPPEHDDMPRDIDEFRRELARRMDALVASRADARLPGGSGNRDT